MMEDRLRLERKREAAHSIVCTDLITFPGYCPACISTQGHPGHAQCTDASNSLTQPRPMSKQDYLCRASHATLCLMQLEQKQTLFAWFTVLHLYVNNDDDDDKQKFHNHESAIQTQVFKLEQ